MRPFFAQEESRGVVPLGSASIQIDAPGRGLASSASSETASFRARIAVYDSAAAAPRIEDVLCASAGGFIEDLSTRSYSIAREAGGSIPYTVVREIVENLIHADFREPVVTVLENGSVLRFSDQGPGIADKRLALEPGFTTASQDMKSHIRGVGSGLPLVSEFLKASGGSLMVDDNLGSGTVVTLRSLPAEIPAAEGADTSDRFPSEQIDLSGVPHLSNRQKRVLSLVLELGEAGPTAVSKELAVGLSTAHRDLAFLEEHGLIASDDSGKRVITAAGSAYLDGLLR